MPILALCRCGNSATEVGGMCADCMEHDAAQRRFRLDARINCSGLPRPLRNQLLGAPMGPARDAARKWSEGEIGGLCLTGPVGVGKTWLAGAAAWERLQSYSVKWVSVARLMAQLRSGFGSESKAKADQILTGTGAIVLDDLDKVSPSDFGKEIIFTAVDNRVEEGAPILVTTNLALSELASRYGDPLASRLAGYCRSVQMTGKDRRLG